MDNVACNHRRTPIDTLLHFRTPGNLPPKKIIKAGNNLPAFCSPALLPGAAVQYTEYSFGAVLTQKVVAREHVFWHHRFYIHEEMTFIPECDKSQLVLQYILEGTMVWNAPGRRVTIIPDVFHICRFAPESNYVLQLEPGNYECFHLAVPDDLEGEMMMFYDETDIIGEGNDKSKVYPYDHFFSIDENIRRDINRILSGRELCFSNHSILINLWREEHLLKLINLYLNHEEQIHRKQKWLENDLLKLSTLEAYVLEHLSESAKLNDSALSLQIVLKRLGISENNFRLIMHRLHNCSWEHFVHRLRMERARQLLLSRPYRSFIEISDMLGYSSPSNFTRAVKEYFRLCPSQLRFGYSKTG